jgi:hypothetical protein
MSAVGSLGFVVDRDPLTVSAQPGERAGAAAVNGKLADPTPLARSGLQFAGQAANGASSCAV